jgi:hypothetical protein
MACGAWPERVHGRCGRELADLAAGGQDTMARLQGPRVLLPQRCGCADDGCHSTDTLRHELRAEATPAACARRVGTPPSARAPPPRRCRPHPAPRKSPSWILTPPRRLADGHRAAQDATLARWLELAGTRTLVRQLGDMLTHRQGSKLPARPGPPGRGL